LRPETSSSEQVRGKEREKETIKWNKKYIEFNRAQKIMFGNYFFIATRTWPTSHNISYIAIYIRRYSLNYNNMTNPAVPTNCVGNLRACVRVLHAWAHSANFNQLNIHLLLLLLLFFLHFTFDFANHLLDVP